MRRNVSESSEIQRFFPPKSRRSPKKKKKKVFAKIQSNFSAEIRNSKVFSSQNKVISKKKRSSPKFRVIFLPISQIQTFEGGSFRMGGAIFHFSQKIGLKSTKNMRFCILHKPMGGPPRPPLATLLPTTRLDFKGECSSTDKMRQDLAYSCRLVQKWWQRWINRYSLSLQKRQKWTTAQRDLLSRNLVLLSHSTTPPVGRYLYAVVVEVRVVNGPTSLGPNPKI